MVDREVIHPIPAEEDSLGGAGFDAISEMTADSLVSDVQPESLEGEVSEVGEGEEAQKKYKIPEKKNEEQRTYDRLYGEYLKAQEQPKKKEKEEKPAEEKPARVEQEPEPSQADQEVTPEPKKKKKGLGGFFKKKKSEESSAGEGEEE